MKPETIARTIVAAIALLNATMVLIGKHRWSGVHRPDRETS